ncbi:MAG TPA: hypothetical protein VMH32_08080 [Burkholderiales bacterium]|nr:hypothetical protein [Burkholderiales bacterium]
MSTEVNPYAAPKAVVEDVSVSANPEAEALRREHIKHEASIRSIGILYYIAALVMAGGAAASALQLARNQPDLKAALSLVAAALLTIGFFVIGRALRALQPRVRIPTAILAGLGLLSFPIGTLINGYILYLLLSKKGRFNLSPEYAAIVEATPHIRYRASILVWAILALLIALAAFAILVPRFLR